MRPRKRRPQYESKPSKKRAPAGHIKRWRSRIGGTIASALQRVRPRKSEAPPDVVEHLARLAVEHWKLLRALERAAGRLPDEHASRAASQHNFFASQLESLLARAGVRLVTFDGRRFEPNLPVAALNAEDAEEADESAEWEVESTVEPAVVKDMKPLVFGKVLIRKTETENDDASGN